MFHLCSVKLGCGSTILPGNWGRSIQFFGMAHKEAAKEIILEHGRLLVAPLAPSRLECCFAFLTQDEANRFRQYAGFFAQLLYEVELVEPGKGFCVFDVTLMRLDGPFDIRWGYRYWTEVTDLANTKEPHIREVLTMSPLRVIRQV